MHRDHIRSPLLVRSLTLIFILLALSSLSPAAYAQGSLIAFLDERDLEVKWSVVKDKPATYSIEILNLYGLDQEIQLRVVGLKGASGEALPDNALIVDATKTVGARRGAAWTLQAGPDLAPTPGVYEGYLVATGQMTGLARRRLTLHVDVGATPTPIVATPQPLPPPALAPEITTTVTVAGTNYLSSLFSPWLTTLASWLLIAAGCGLVWWLWTQRKLPSPGPNDPLTLTPVKVASWLVRVALIIGLLVIVGILRASADMFVDAAKRCFFVDPKWPGYETCARVVSHVIEMRLIRSPAVPVTGAGDLTLVGLATAADGSLAQLALQQGRLALVDAPRAGKYEGRIDLLPNDPNKGIIQITANIADWWLWAVATLAVGVGLGYVVTSYMRTGRRAALLRLRSAQQVARIVDDQRVFRQQHPDNIFANLSLQGLTMEWQTEFLNHLDRSRGEDDLKPLQESVGQLDALFTDFKDYRSLTLDLDDTRDKVVVMARNLVRGQSVAPFNVFRQTQTAITQKPLLYTSLRNVATALDGRRKEVEGLIAWLHSLADVLAHVMFLLEDVESIVPPAKRGEFRKRLRMVAVGALSADKPEDLAAQEDEADRIYAEIHPPAAGPVLPEAPADVPGEKRRAIPGRWGIGRRRPTPTPETRQAHRLQQLFDRSELQMTLLMGLLAVGTGLYNLYFKNPAWGTSADYLYALLWGSAVSEGLKYITYLVNRVWNPEVKE